MSSRLRRNRTITRRPLAWIREGVVVCLVAAPVLSQAPTKAPIPAPKTLTDYKSQLVSIPAGRFQMGAKPVPEANPDKLPIHWVQLNAFKIGRTPVTVSMFKEYCVATKHPMPEPPAWGWTDDHPMVNVSWEEAADFAKWAAMRLPTEAEWEFSARGGEASQEFPWGDTYRDEITWSSVMMQRDKTVPVVRPDHIHVNGYGLTDMAGNVFQWCSDWYAADYYTRSPETNPTGPEKGEAKVLRGASWYSYTILNSFRCAGRASSHPAGRGDSDGFRLCQSKPTGAVLPSASEPHR